MRRAIRLAAALAALAATSNARAETAGSGELVAARPIKAVVELFTSQGCSSCPPADRLMRSYAERKDVLAYSMPVDIWDHLGWKDTLASPKYTQRQRAYASTLTQGGVYTPQMVINGTAHVVGSHRADIDDAIDQQSQDFAARRVAVSFVEQNGQVLVDLGTGQRRPQARKATVWLGILQRSVSVPIRRGENAGATVTYYNVVRHFTLVGSWDGSPERLPLPALSTLKAGIEEAFVLVQEGQTGPIIGAARLGG